MALPIYRKIANDIVKKIESGELRPGDKVQTEAELQTMYAVSRITVTNALRELQNRDLVQRVKGSGTYISRKRSAGPSVRPGNGMSIISAVFPQGEQNGAHEILLGIERECAQKGYYVTIHNSRNKAALEHSIILDLLSQGCGGLIVFPCFSADKNADVYSDLVIRSFPAAFIDRRLDFLDIPLVACDNTGAMRDLVAGIVRNGHERIGFFCNSIETVSSEHERFQGYCEGCVAAGLRVRPELVFRRYREIEKPEEILDVERVDGWHYAEAALEFFLRARERPTCVVAVNDILAIGLMKAAQAKGIRIPDDLAITGFDDLDAARYLEPPLTTVRQPFEEIGVAAARLLISRIEGGDAPKREVRIPGKIVLRESVKQTARGERRAEDPSQGTASRSLRRASP